MRLRQAEEVTEASLAQEDCTTAGPEYWFEEDNPVVRTYEVPVFTPVSNYLADLIDPRRSAAE